MAALTVGSANLDWPSLGFKVRDVAGHMEVRFRDGTWEEPHFVAEPMVTMPVTATVLHYGQACFEGLKAFAQPDGSVCVWNDAANLARLQQSCERLVLPHVDEALWRAMVGGCVQHNIAYVPPPSAPKGCAMYLRPVLFGSGAGLGVAPSSEATLLVIGMPVSSYYGGEPGALPAAIRAKVVTHLDRAAHLGVGHVKAAGNYAADMYCQEHLKKLDNIPIGLYLDAKEKRFIEEFNTSNFIAITDGGKTYLTPSSSSILQSTTNRCLQTIAREELGMNVEARPVEFLQEHPQFEEVGAVGTAVVVQPIRELVYVDDGGEARSWVAKGDPTVIRRLYSIFLAMQRGEHEDKFGWLRKVA